MKNPLNKLREADIETQAAEAARNTVEQEFLTYIQELKTTHPDVLIHFRGSPTCGVAEFFDDSGQLTSLVSAPTYSLLDDERRPWEGEGWSLRGVEKDLSNRDCVALVRPDQETGYVLFRPGAFEIFEAIIPEND